MITYNSEPIKILAGDSRDRLATIEWPDGKIRVVAVERLRGNRGGIMEVIAVWQQACRQTANENRK